MKKNLTSENARNKIIHAKRIFICGAMLVKCILSILCLILLNPVSYHIGTLINTIAIVAAYLIAFEHKLIVKLSKLLTVELDYLILGHLIIFMPR